MFSGCLLWLVFKIIFIYFGGLYHIHYKLKCELFIFLSVWCLHGPGQVCAPSIILSEMVLMRM